MKLELSALYMYMHKFYVNVHPGGYKQPAWLTPARADTSNQPGTRQPEQGTHEPEQGTHVPQTGTRQLMLQYTTLTLRLLLFISQITNKAPVDCCGLHGLLRFRFTVEDLRFQGFRVLGSQNFCGRMGR